ncbi:MAG: 50S ribosomal protein L17 [Candidatus Omnitrophota bacterium]
MRHAKKRLQLGRFGAWRRATLKGLARSLLIYQSIRTTKARAMAVKPLVDQLISLAKENTLSSRRRAFKILQDHRLVSMLFSDIGPRFDKRTGGYTRVLNLGPRRGDNASLAILELVEIKKKERKHPKKALKETQPEAGPVKDKPAQEEKTEKPPVPKKVSPKKFLGGLRSIFKKERGSP